MAATAPAQPRRRRDINRAKRSAAAEVESSPTGSSKGGSKRRRELDWDAILKDDASEDEDDDDDFADAQDEPVEAGEGDEEGLEMGELEDDAEGGESEGEEAGEDAWEDDWISEDGVSGDARDGGDVSADSGGEGPAPTNDSPADDHHARGKKARKRRRQQGLRQFKEEKDKMMGLEVVSDAKLVNLPTTIERSVLPLRDLCLRYVLKDRARFDLTMVPYDLLDRIPTYDLKAKVLQTYVGELTNNARRYGNYHGDATLATLYTMASNSGEARYVRLVWASGFSVDDFDLKRYNYKKNKKTEYYDELDDKNPEWIKTKAMIYCRTGNLSEMQTLLSEQIERQREGVAREERNAHEARGVKIAELRATLDKKLHPADPLLTQPISQEEYRRQFDEGLTTIRNDQRLLRDLHTAKLQLGSSLLTLALLHQFHGNARAAARLALLMCDVMPESRDAFQDMAGAFLQARGYDATHLWQARLGSTTPTHYRRVCEYMIERDRLPDLVEWLRMPRDDMMATLDFHPHYHLALVYSMMGADASAEDAWRPLFMATGTMSPFECISSLRPIGEMVSHIPVVWRAFLAPPAVDTSRSVGDMGGAYRSDGVYVTGNVVHFAFSDCPVRESVVMLDKRSGNLLTEEMGRDLPQFVMPRDVKHVGACFDKLLVVVGESQRTRLTVWSNSPQYLAFLTRWEDTQTIDICKIINRAYLQREREACVAAGMSIERFNRLAAARGGSIPHRRFITEFDTKAKEHEESVAKKLKEEKHSKVGLKEEIAKIPQMKLTKRKALIEKLKKAHKEKSKKKIRVNYSLVSVDSDVSSYINLDEYMRVGHRHLLVNIDNRTWSQRDPQTRQRLRAIRVMGGIVMLSMDGSKFKHPEIYWSDDPEYWILSAHDRQEYMDCGLVADEPCAMAVRVNELTHGVTTAIFDTATGTLIKEVPGFAGRSCIGRFVYGMSWKEGESIMLERRDIDRDYAVVASVSLSEQIRQGQTFVASIKGGNCMRLGRQHVYSYDGPLLRIWSANLDLVHETRIDRMFPEDNTARVICEEREGTRVVLSVQNHAIIFDSATGTVLRNLDLQRLVHSAVFTPHGLLIATAARVDRDDMTPPYATVFWFNEAFVLIGMHPYVGESTLGLCYDAETQCAYYCDRAGEAVCLSLAGNRKRTQWNDAHN